MTPLDDLARTHQGVWTEMARAGQSWTVPWLDLDAHEVRAFAEGRIPGDAGPLFQLHPARLLRRVDGADVLCLATGGGQQSAVFGLLGARVTVADLTEAQLDGDRRAAAHYGYPVTTVQADMRDLSALPTAGYDLVFQAPSLGWVPDAGEVFRQVARVLRPGGVYRLHAGNPANAALEWDGQGYRVAAPYAVRAFPQEKGACHFRHSLRDLFGGLLGNGLAVEEVFEHPWSPADAQATPGSWDHEMAYNVAIVIVARAASPGAGGTELSG